MQNQFCLWHQICSSAQASQLLAGTVWYSLADRMARPHQNLPVTFFTWFRHIPFSHWDWVKRSDQKTHHAKKAEIDARFEKRREGEPVVVVLFCVIISICWGKGEMNGGINGWWFGGGEEEIPLSGWNWMASLGMGEVWGPPDVEGAVRSKTAGSLSSQ